MFVAAIALFLAACDNNSTEKKAPETTKQQAAPPVTTAMQLKDDKLNAIYAQYALLVAALTKGDAPAARIAANAIEAGAATIKEGSSTGAAAASIVATADIEAQRTAFAALSTALITLVKQSGLSAGVLYVDFCPMAMNNQGAYWLSESSRIKNPYFGEQMLTCGEVKETLK
jgi:hypothetical protein